MCCAAMRYLYIWFQFPSSVKLIPMRWKKLAVALWSCARLLAAKACNVMALLDGGMLGGQKSRVKVRDQLLVDYVVMPISA